MPDDLVLDLLLDMARGAFQLVFEPSDQRAEATAYGIPWIPGGPFRATESPLHEEFTSALAEDPVLKIFAPPNEPWIFSSSGGGMLIGEGEMPGLLIASASAAHNARGKPKDDLNGFLCEVEGTLQSLRRLLTGEEVTALTVVAFDGLTLRGGARVETPWGWLRAATDLEAATTPMHVVPTVVLVIESPVRFVIGETEGASGLRANQERTRRAGELLPLAALLGIEREERISLGQVWSTQVQPLLRSGYGVSSPTGPRARHAMLFRRSGRPRAGGDSLTEEEERQLGEWASLVERHYDPVIEIAAGRTISAIRERNEPHDALIDAVIALESLFGHGGTTEVGFRVTAAAAHLLEPSPANRAELKSRLSKVYDARSKVIHGAALTANVLSQRREEAIDAAVGSLRALFSERPHLIADPDRGMRLILGTADPLAEAATDARQDGHPSATTDF